MMHGCEWMMHGCKTIHTRMPCGSGTYAGGIRGIRRINYQCGWDSASANAGEVLHLSYVGKGHSAGAQGDDCGKPAPSFPGVMPRNILFSSAQS